MHNAGQSDVCRIVVFTLSHYIHDCGRAERVCDQVLMPMSCSWYVCVWRLLVVVKLVGERSDVMSSKFRGV